MSIDALIRRATERIAAAIDRFNPCLVVGLNSGGHDSLTANFVASQAKRFDGCLHINTGTGIPATRQFVVDTCAARNWRLWEYHAKDNTKADGTPDPMDYEQMCLKYGFPGPAGHRVMYIKLKERQIERFLRDVGATPEHPVLFISGARSEESKRRMGNTNTEASIRGYSV